MGDPSSKPGPPTPTPGRIGSGDVDPELSTVLPGGLSTLAGASDADSLLAAIAAAPGPPAGPAIAEGAVIGGNFRVVRRLGAGGMGVVYLAHDLTLDRPVAVKLHRGAGAAGVERLQREATAMARLSHPNVVTVHAVGRLDDAVFVAMEYVRGGTLRSWLRAQPRPWTEALAMCRAAGEGLAAAHEVGLVHRDFKPENVLVADGGRPKVADFGLARAQDDDGPEPGDAPITASGSGSDHGSGRRSDRLTLTGAMVGTPAYMAPEQFHGKVDARADQFALAVVVWEALFGQRPFAGADARAIEAAVRDGAIASPPRRHDVPRAVIDAVRRALSPAPADRYPSVRVFLHALERAAHPRRGLAIGGAVIVAGGVAATIALLGRGGDAGDPCARATAPIDAALPAALVERLDLAVAEAPGHAATRDRVRTRLADARAHLTAAAATSCRAGLVDRVYPREVYDRSQACVAYQARLVAMLADDVPLVRRDLAAYASKVRALPAAAHCLDPVALVATPAPPAAAAMQARADLEVASASVQIDQLADAEAAIARAAPTAAADPAVAALLLRVRGELAFARGELAAAEKLLTDAYYGGVAVDDADVYLHALARLVHLLGDERADAAAAAPWIRTAEAAVQKDLRRSPAAVASLELALAAAADRRGDGAAAVAHAEAAVALSRNDTDPLTRSAREHALANALTGAGRYEDAVRRHEAAVAACGEALGADHPTCIAETAAHALTLYEIDNVRAIELASAAHVALQDWPDAGILTRVTALLDVGAVLSSHPDHRDAAAADTRLGRDLARTLFGPAHPTVALAEANLAVIDLKRGDHAGAAAAFERALAIQERTLGGEHFEVGGTLFNLATARLFLGEYAAALPIAARTSAIFAKTAPRSLRWVYARRLEAELLTRLGRAREAAPIAAEALAVADTLEGAAYFDVGLEVARADVALGQRLPAARARLLEARPQFAQWPDVFKRQLAAIDELLATLDRTR